MQRDDAPAARAPGQPHVDRGATRNDRRTLYAPLPTYHENARRIRQNAAVLGIDDLYRRLIGVAQ
jgi:hypothetical protein